MSEQFSLCWDNFHKNMSSGIQSMLETEDLVDVTLAVEGRNLKAHKMVLSVCSPYFRELFQSNPCKHPIVFMKDVSYIALSDLLQFMYQGEVQVAQENLATFIKTAEALQIKGLTGDSGAPNDSETDQEVEKPFPEAAKRNFEAVEQKLIPRSKRSAGPLSKKPKLNDTVITSTPTHQPLVSVVSTSTKYEVTSVNTNNTHVTDEIDLKMEPSENEVLQNDAVDENPIEQYADDSTTFEMADDGDDISLMESGNEEPKAGTSTEAGESQEIIEFGIPNKNKSHQSHEFLQDLTENLIQPQINRRNVSTGIQCGIQNGMSVLVPNDNKISPPNKRLCLERKRCFMCPSKKSRKQKQTCKSCEKNVCNEHSVKIVTCKNCK